MYCPNCGQENITGAKFCRNCGFNLTGESEDRNREYAGFWLRFAAWLIDSVLVSTVAWIIIIPTVFVFADISLTGFAIWFFFVLGIIYILPWLYYALMEASSKQGTLGKMVVGIIVTDEAGNRISFGRATGRYFGKILSGLIIYIGYLMIAFTGKKQGLHDILARTLVVKK